MARPFDPNNYVSATGDPSQPYVAVVDGVSHPFNNQGDAENAYNALSGGGGGTTYSSPSAPTGTATAPGSTTGSDGIQTRDGLLSPDELRRRLEGAHYGGPWDPASMAAAYNRADPSYRSPSAPGAASPYGGGMEGFVNLGQADLAERAAVAQAQLALQRDQFNQLQLPSLGLQQQVAGWQNDYQNRALAQQSSQFGSTLGLQQGQLDLQRQLGQGDLGLRGLGQASQEALARASLGTQAAQIADQQAMARANLIASLRGPADAFQQQKVLYGLNAQGGSGLADILSGKAGAPSFQGAQAQPVAASLDTLANQMQGLPVDAQRTVSGMDGGSGPGSAVSAAGYNPTSMLMRAAQNYLGNSYSSPTIDAAMQTGLGNTQAAQPVNPTAWAGASQRLVAAYDPKAQGPDVWARTLGLAPQDAQRLYNAASAWHMANPEAGPASDAQIAGWAHDLGIGAPGAYGSTGYGVGQQYAQGGYASPASPNGVAAQGRMYYQRQAQPAGGDPMYSGMGQQEMAAPNGTPTGRGQPMVMGGYASPANPRDSMGGDGGDPMMAGTAATGGQTGQGQAGQFLSSMPAPNQIVARNYLRLPQSSQQFALGAYESQGYSPEDVQNTIQKSLPQQSQASRTYGLQAA